MFAPTKSRLESVSAWSQSRLLCCAALLSACTIVSSTAHPAVRNAPASEQDSDESRSAAVLGAAANDLGCSTVEVVMTFDREYANTALPRYVLQGCDKRALYAEDCSEYPRCRYVLLSLLPLGAPPRVPE